MRSKRGSRKRAAFRMWLAAAAATCGMASAPSMATAAEWDLAEARGCVAANPSGSRVACINVTGGRAQLELKHPKTRRLYKVMLLGSDAAPSDPQATPARTWAAVTKTLRKGGYEWLAQGDIDRPAGQRATTKVPGLPCALSISDDDKYIVTVDAADAAATRRPWMTVGRPAGKAKLLSVARHDSSRVVYLTLEHDLTDAEGPLHVRQFKTVDIKELASRKECGGGPATPAEPSGDEAVSPTEAEKAP